MLAMSTIQENSKLLDRFHAFVVDLVAPWLIAVEQALGGGKMCEQIIVFQALTIIDKGMALLEIELCHSAMSLQIATLLTWYGCVVTIDQ